MTNEQFPGSDFMPIEYEAEKPDEPGVIRMSPIDPERVLDDYEDFRRVGGCQLKPLEAQLRRRLGDEVVDALPSSRDFPPDLPDPEEKIWRGLFSWFEVSKKRK